MKTLKEKKIIFLNTSPINFKVWLVDYLKGKPKKTLKRRINLIYFVRSKFESMILREEGNNIPCLILREMSLEWPWSFVRAFYRSVFLLDIHLLVQIKIYDCYKRKLKKWALNLIWRPKCTNNNTSTNVMVSRFYASLMFWSTYLAITLYTTFVVREIQNKHIANIINQLRV